MDTELIPVDQEKIDKIALDRAGEIIRSGGLVGFPTETVYGLGGNGLDPRSAKAIYAAKGRPSDNPLILHIADRNELYSLVSEIPETAEKLMDAFWPGPMTLVFLKSELVPKESTGGLDTVAIRMPSHPVAAALIRAAGVPIAAPSANRSGRPSPTMASHVWEDMDGRIEMILDGGEVGIGLESTIIDLTEGVPTILRPGYITQTMIENVIGHTEVDKASTGENTEHVRPKAPGMKYRHYAPKAEMTLVSGESEKVCRKLLELSKESITQGKRVRIICTEETKSFFAEREAVSVGFRRHPEMIAHNLFRILREADQDGVEVLLSETFEETELGAAVMNRLMKAAGYHIIYL
ncbi:MAG: threonylcarbamoyl-AMP synthase [Lachnospiraceae bacterium]|nr:threonylcarbamoyl-AMP synthase [Lachnospiraceae bacterium]